MLKNSRGFQQIFCLLILIITVYTASISKTEANPFFIVNQHPVLQVYQVANPLEVYQTEQFNVSVSITNVYFEDVLNMTATTSIPNELELLSSSIPELDLENNSEDFYYNFGPIALNQNINFTLTYNVTSEAIKTLTLEGLNVSFRLQNGIESYRITNQIDILLKGERDVTPIKPLKPIPTGTIPAEPILSIFGYLIPLIIYGFSIIIMRRFRKYP